MNLQSSLCIKMDLAEANMMFMWFMCQIKWLSVLVVFIVVFCHDNKPTCNHQVVSLHLNQETLSTES